MKKKTNRTYIGGQAVIQGVMMRGKRGMAMAVRDEKGEMQMEAKRITPPEKRSKATKIPFVRGVVNFVVSLVSGMKALLRSSEVVVGEDEDPSKLSEWVEQKLKVGVGSIISVFATIIGVLLAVGLFVFLPIYLTGLIADAFPATFAGEDANIWYNLVNGGFRLVIFIFYILFTLCFKSLRETYRYHGAEHKTINCYEYGMPLTVENVKKCSRLHDRCGTTFIFIVLVISIVLFSLVGWLVVGLAGFTPELLGGSKILHRVIMTLIKLCCLPIVAGISYEFLKLFSLTNFPLFFPFKAPGYLLQLLTTREPSDDMIECAIAAFEKTLDMDENPDSPEKTFATETKLSKLMEMMKKSFAEKNIEDADAEWILSLTLKIPRSELGKDRVVKQSACKKILEIYEERLTGRPLWYIYGDTEFYGYKLKVDERVLIPRPETEVLVRQAVSVLNDGDSMLDLCTGSGAIAIAVACEAAKDKAVTVVGADISDGALELAKENARMNKANVSFVKSDLFSNVRGRYNLITVNPPYIKTGDIENLQPEVRDFEPRIALDGGEDGLEFYRKIAEKVTRYLVRGGMLIVECGEDQAQEVIKIFKTKSRCDYTMVVRDLEGVARIIKIGY